MVIIFEDYIYRLTDFKRIMLKDNYGPRRKSAIVVFDGDWNADVIFESEYSELAREIYDEIVPAIRDDDDWCDCRDIIETYRKTWGH